MNWGGDGIGDDGGDGIKYGGGEGIGDITDDVGDGSGE